MSNRLTQATYPRVGLVQALLVVRFLLKALAADEQVRRAQFIYAVSGPLSVPFVGRFGVAPLVLGGAREPYTLLAVVVYAAGGWRRSRIVGLLAGATQSAPVAGIGTTLSRSCR